MPNNSKPAQKADQETITLEPNWENTTRWFARGLSEHAFDKGALSPVISFIEQVRYLAHRDPEALERVLNELKAREAS
jgi:hypothetical protein